MVWKYFLGNEWMSSSPQLPHSYHLESAQAGHSENQPKHTPQILYTGNLGLFLCFRAPFFPFCPICHGTWSHGNIWKNQIFACPDTKSQGGGLAMGCAVLPKKVVRRKGRGCSFLNYYFQKTIETPKKLCKWWVCSKHSVSYYANVFVVGGGFLFPSHSCTKKFTELTTPE